MGKTMTAAQMAWALRRGFAWADQGNEGEDCHCLHEVFWTRDGGYQWDVDRQVYVMVF